MSRSIVPSESLVTVARQRLVAATGARWHVAQPVARNALKDFDVRVREAVTLLLKDFGPVVAIMVMGADAGKSQDC